MSRFLLIWLTIAASVPRVLSAAESLPAGDPSFYRHVVPLFGKLGCNGGACHGAVKGQKGFRLSLYGADPAGDYQRLRDDDGGRRLNLSNPDESLILQKGTEQVSHGGGPRMEWDGPEYKLLRRWIAGGARLDDPRRSRVTDLQVSPIQKVARPGESYPLQVTAQFADGSREDVTGLCVFESLDKAVAAVDNAGQVTAVSVGDVRLMVRFGAQPVAAQVFIPRPGARVEQNVRPFNFVDQHILAKLDRLNVPPAALCDDATFLRRVRLDVTGQLPTPDEVREFLADGASDKRSRKVRELLESPDHADLWTLKFGDLLKGSNFGVYSDSLSRDHDAPRWQAWIRARLHENVPYDEFVERILLATSREGRGYEAYGDEVRALIEGFRPGRPDLEVYAQRRTLDLYWQRKGLEGVNAAMQVAHAFLGLRLECAQCHRHPHDVWQQEDLLDFANFFTPVRIIGYQRDSEKTYPDAAAYVKPWNDEYKEVEAAVKERVEGMGKQLKMEARAAQELVDKTAAELRAKKIIDEKNEEVIALQKLRMAAKEATRRSDEYMAETDAIRRAGTMKVVAARRIMYGEVRLNPNPPVAKVVSTLGTRESRAMRLLGEATPVRGLAGVSNTSNAASMPNSETMMLSPSVERAAQRVQLARPSSENRAPEAPTPKKTPTEPAKATPPAPLLREDATTTSGSDDPRMIVMQWMRRPDNPYFARAIVNRVWAHYFGRGIVDPPDNLSVFNPPSHPELLDELSQKFIANRYDLRWLHRTILESRTYQQSSLPSPGVMIEPSHFAVFPVRRLSAEIVFEAVNAATGTKEKMNLATAFLPDNLNAIQVPFIPNNPFAEFMLESYGKPARNAMVQCDCERDESSSVLQVLALVNHPQILEKLKDRQGRVATLLQRSLSDAARVDELYLAVLSRLPDSDERAVCLEVVGTAETPRDGWQTVLWSLLNTREFVLQH